MAKGDWFGPEIQMDVTPLLEGVQKFDKKLDIGVAGVFEYYEPRIQAWMKKNAPWTDRTGNARNGLRAVAGHERGKAHWVDLFHSVPYGIWLEVRFSGRYSIVIPAIVEFGPKVMRTLNKLFARLGR